MIQILGKEKVCLFLYVQITEKSLISIFGGEERLTKLRRHLETVHECATLIVISHGWTQVIEKALERTNLLEFFENTIDIFGTPSDETQSLIQKNLVWFM